MGPHDMEPNSSHRKACTRRSRRAANEHLQAASEHLRAANEHLQADYSRIYSLCEPTASPWKSKTEQISVLLSVYAMFGITQESRLRHAI